MGERPPPDAPSIGIVTPNYNGGHFLAATIDSILTQDYPSLRYHVQDGGSTDGSCDVLRSYGARLTWRSERDSGQARRRSTGPSPRSAIATSWLMSTAMTCC